VARNTLTLSRISLVHGQSLPPRRRPSSTRTQRQRGCPEAQPEETGRLRGPLGRIGAPCGPGVDAHRTPQQYGILLRPGRRPVRIPHGSMVNHRTLTSAMIDSRDFLAAKRRAESEVLLPASRRTQDRLHRRPRFQRTSCDLGPGGQGSRQDPDLVLLHGGTPRGTECRPPAEPTIPRCRRERTSSLWAGAAGDTWEACFSGACHKSSSRSHRVELSWCPRSLSRTGP
jgi:hypothetical protein